MFSAVYIFLMIVANLIGFGMGHNDLYLIFVKIWEESSFLYIFKVFLYLIPFAIGNFYVREKEREQNERINF